MSIFAILVFLAIALAIISLWRPHQALVVMSIVILAVAVLVQGGAIRAG